jgi:transcriptional regulator with XRE-family HTH domain
VAHVTDAPFSRRISIEVARSLRTERLRQKLSISGVARIAGLSHQMVSYVERGMRNPTLDTLLRIASALNVDLPGLIKRASKMADAKR